MEKLKKLLFDKIKMCEIEFDGSKIDMDKVEEIKKIEKILNKPILPNEIWCMIEEYRKEEFLRRVYNFEVEFGLMLRYGYVQKIRHHVGAYIHKCYDDISRFDIRGIEDDVPSDEESELDWDEGELNAW
jgi:hypothetical protein